MRISRGAAHRGGVHERREACAPASADLGQDPPRAVKQGGENSPMQIATGIAHQPP